MALALNNLKRVDMPLNKEAKPNQTEQILGYYAYLAHILCDHIKW